MIRSFSCKNFYSFADENIVSLLVNDKAPISDIYADSLSGERISKALVIIGPNASGKTNLIKVLPFLKWFILDSFKVKLDAEIPVKPFIFNNTKNNPTEISIEFEIEKEIYEYFVSITNKRIIAEELKIKTKGKQRLTSKTLFVRSWNSETEKYEFTGKNFKLPKDFKKSLRNNASIISIANQFNHIGSKTVTDYWSKIRTNVVETGLPENLFPFLSSFNFFGALEFYSENKILKEKAEKILARFDLGITSFDVKKEKKERGSSLDATVFHSINGGSFEIPIIYESSGTKQLVTLLKSILQVLEDGSIAILDELDAYLHPDMVEALFELFISPDTNTKNAQIIFSTHSHRILNQMDKYQIILTEKNDHGSSEAWRLDDVDGVRADDNYYAKYVAGAYGAVPNID